LPTSHAGIDFGIGNSSLCLCPGYPAADAYSYYYPHRALAHPHAILYFSSHRNTHPHSQPDRDAYPIPYSHRDTYSYSHSRKTGSS